MRLRADTRNLTSVGERETSDEVESYILDDAVLERQDESLVVLVEDASKVVGKVASSLGARMDRGMECFTSRVSSSLSVMASCVSRKKDGRERK
jgi:hypothetical protein